jgi:hypothetical protein
MRNHVLSKLLILILPLLVLSGCKKDEPLKTNTTFTLTLTEETKPGTFTGYFTSSGDPTTSGTFTMMVQQVGADSLHCSQTLATPDVGTITIISDCSLTNNTGDWYITEGSGSYANLEGNGSLIMSFPTNAPVIEALYGKTWRQ